MSLLRALDPTRTMSPQELVRPSEPPAPISQTSAIIATLVVVSALILLCFSCFSICVRGVRPRKYCLTTINPIILIFTWPYHVYRFILWATGRRGYRTKEKDIEACPGFSTPEMGGQWEGRWMPIPVSFGAVVNDAQEMVTSVSPTGRPGTFVRLPRPDSGNPREFILVPTPGKLEGGNQHAEVDLGGLRPDLNIVYPPEEQDNPLSLPPITFSAHFHRTSRASLRGPSAHSFENYDSLYYVDGHNEIGGENAAYFAGQTRSMRRSRLAHMSQVEDYGGVQREDSFDSIDLGAQALGRKSKEQK